MTPKSGSNCFKFGGIWNEPGKLIPLLDNAYQGYASGHLAKDGYSQKLNLNCKESMHHPDTLTLEISRTTKNKKSWQKWRFTESGMEFFVATWLDLHCFNLVQFRTSIDCTAFDGW